MKRDITPLQFFNYEREVIVRLIKSKTPKDIANTLSPDMFEDFIFRKIFKCCKESIEANGFIDEYAIADQMNTVEQKKAFDALQKDISPTANYKFFADRLKQQYFDRLIGQCKTVEEMKAVQNEIDYWTDISVLEPISTGSDTLLCDYYDKWESSVKTGFKNLDNVIGSLQSGDFVIFAGATSSGKTMCALNIMLNIAKAGHKCNLYSLEMTRQQLQNRIISCETGINSSAFRTFTLTEEDQKKHLQYATEELPKLNINICSDYRNLTVEKIVSLEKKSDSEIVFIDYLGLIKSNIKGNQYEKITEISTELKKAALDLKKPFFVLHQLSRELFNRQEKRPCLSDLRGSGQLEQDADMVMFVHRPAYFDPEADPTDLEIIVAKNRHGENNKILPFTYLPSRQKIVERGVVTWNKQT